MDTTAFDIWLNYHLSQPITPKGSNKVKVNAGPSIVEMIEKEHRVATGSYRLGLGEALFVIERTNCKGEKPYFALAHCINEAPNILNPDYLNGLETAFFIFKTPYKWLAGERV